MKKLVLSFLVLAFVSFAANSYAQSIKIGFSGEYDVLMSDDLDGLTGGYGANLDVKLNPIGKLAFGLKAGYLTFPAENATGLDVFKYKMIPVNASIEYSLFEKIVKPYVGLAGGMYFTTVKFEAGGFSYEASESDFGIAPKAGVLIGLGEFFNLHAYSQYNMVFIEDVNGDTGVSQFLGINVGLMYGFGL